ncbi:hypothetical protein GA0070216_11551 [Micromonospora matsumotoense]|uniref:Uncharacterized protein n=2 Tax=Micromonospora matsumotoense TaxID=121616 RepID=A0A1C5AAL6_9ACTN|nr:hypothetical protein GA0070216_11551 [Micromonospora matsumotoense]
MRTVEGMEVLLRGGPGDGQVVPGGGEIVAWRACLYEITLEFGHLRERDLRVYRHRSDCCEAFGRGAEDRCE